MAPTPNAARRLHALPVGMAALALVLSGCAGSGEDGGEGQASAAPSSSSAQTSSDEPQDPQESAASVAAESFAAQSSEGSRRPQPREALETKGPGVKGGAADGNWVRIASSRNDTVSVQDCSTDVLDQGTLDAIATHIPNANSLEITQLFASRDVSHEFMSCSYSTFQDRAPGMPSAMVTYQHNRDGKKLDWCSEEAPVEADEYSWDPKTGKGLMALLRPGMIGGQDGAPLLPQRTAWQCNDEGTEMVLITLGAMEGYGDANEGLESVKNSPVKDSTTIVTEARDHLADTMLKDPKKVREVISTSSPVFMDYQMDEKTLEEAKKVPAGKSDPDELNDQSMLDRPEGAPGPVAPGMPPRPSEDAEESGSE